MWRTILILLIIIFLASIYSPVLLLAFFLLFFIYSIKFLDKAFLLYCYLLSFNGVIRLFNLENPVSASFIT
ncbi:hypothetical protein, partial [Bacillus sp. JJ1566]|uniref:hypothetical protein n=1 Tax=Bacillus sp. JJ1566 TaxID=3122961 RepID=UPI00300055DD